jgi:CBS domain-containing protein
MKVGELCCRQVVVAEPELSVLEAARRMRDYHVGDLVVVDPEEPDSEPVGVVTDRDLVIDGIAAQANLERLRVKDVMTSELITVEENEDVSSALEQMRARGVRRMPVVDVSGALQGILTYDDLVDWVTEQLGDLHRIVDNQRRLEERRLSAQSMKR